MAVLPDPSPAAPRGWSLERRLPLLISALLACALGAFGAAAYREMRLASEDRAASRLEGVARELVASSVASGAARLTTLRALAAQPVVRGAALRGGGDSVLAARLDAAQPATDSTLVGWELLSANRVRRVRLGAPATARDAEVLGATLAEAATTDSLRRSPFYAVGERVFLWTVVPIDDANGTSIGFLAEHRRLARNPRTEYTLRQLTGDDVQFAFANSNSPEWASVGGSPIPPRVRFDADAPPGRVTIARGAAGARHYAVQAPLPGTPRIIVLTQSESSVLRRPREFLRAMIIVGVALLLVVGAFGAWLVGRHVTRPLVAITRASEAIAAGEYGNRVGDAGGGSAELTQLARSFDLMAARVGTAHEALADHNAALHRANAAKSQFLAMMSHELRTPLNAIGGYAELVQLGLRGPVTAQQVEDLGRIRRNKDHLLSIITDILSFARADAGRISLEMGPVRLATALSDVRELVGRQFVAKGIALHIEEPPADAVLHADRDKLQQVLLNLLTNALKFTDRGGTVSVEHEQLAEVTRVSVRDTGIGIEREKLDTIFEPFVQVDAGLTRRVGGTGLGLAIVRDLSRAMGGSVSAESVPGEGSTFTLTMPRMPRRETGDARGAAATATAPDT